MRIWVLIFLLALLLGACSSEDNSSAEQTAVPNSEVPSTLDFPATATVIVATEMQETQVFIAERNARRTDVALTREPTAAVVMLTPIPMELTITSVVEGIYGTQTAVGSVGQQQTAEAGLLAMTATAEYRATNPDWTQTPQPTWPPLEGCQPVLAAGNMIEVEASLSAALNDAEIMIGNTPLVFAGVMDISELAADPDVQHMALIEVAQSVLTGFGQSCPEDEIYYVRLLIDVVGFEELPDEAMMADLIVQQLAVLAAFEDEIEVGARPTRLKIDFKASGRVNHIWVETSYANAIRAYQERLQGSELISALGGWMIP